jgi:hypothetical protein
MRPDWIWSSGNEGIGGSAGGAGGEGSPRKRTKTAARIDG